MRLGEARSEREVVEVVVDASPCRRIAPYLLQTYDDTEISTGILVSGTLWLPEPMADLDDQNRRGWGRRRLALSESGNRNARSSMHAVELLSLKQF